MDSPHLADRSRSVFITTLSVLHHTGLTLMPPRRQQAEREVARFFTASVKKILMIKIKAKHAKQVHLHTSF